MLGQLRLAWWREQLRMPVATWSDGEPLLAALRCWKAEQGALVALVDGWEALTGAPPLPGEAMETLAAGRGGAFAALARLVGVPDAAAAAERLGVDWALADLAARLGHADERSTAAVLVARRDWAAVTLPRRLRPLAVLRGLARRAVRHGERLAVPSSASLAAALRIGLLGR